MFDDHFPDRRRCAGDSPSAPIAVLSLHRDDLDGFIVRRDEPTGSSPSGALTEDCGFNIFFVTVRSARR